MPTLTNTLAAVLSGPVTLEELKHKPGRRRTLRARAGERSAIAKVYASDRASTVGARVAALATGPPDPCVPRVLLVDPALHLVVLSEVSGPTLREALLATDLPECRRAGASLGRWHRAWSGTHPVPLRPHTAPRELAILAQRAAAAPPEIGAEVRSAADGLAAPWPISGVVHRDLYEEQILLGPEIGLIDLDDAALGPPELDVGNLLGHVELLADRSRTNLTQPLRALLEGYAEAGPHLEPELLDRCRKLALLRLACIHGDPKLAAAAVAV